jgi:hypothetical protein
LGSDKPLIRGIQGTGQVGARNVVGVDFDRAQVCGVLLAGSGTKRRNRETVRRSENKKRSKREYEKNKRDRD